MRIKHVPHALAATLLLLTCAAIASAQVVPASGKVTLKQADGTTVPVQGAVVEIYRTDISGKYTTKTDKSGNYIYAGIPFGGTYTIIVSAPNARPDFMTGLRLSQQGENNFTLEAGDGRKLTLDDVKAAAGAAPAGAAGGGDPTAARRAKEEMAKREAAFEAEKAKVAATNAQLNDLLKAGNDALGAKNYDQAITSYDQGIQADPEQAVFHLNKSVALRSRGVDRYNAAVKAKDTAGRDAAKADLKAAAEAAEKAITNYRALAAKSGAAGGAGGAGAAGAAAPTGGGPKSDELNYLAARYENYRIALQTGSSDLADAASKAIQEYVTVETDPAKKAKAQISLADALLQGGQVEQSIAAYRQALTTNPDNLDAMYGLGIALAADPSQSKEKLAEARDALQKFAAKAPATDSRKQEAAAAADGISQSLKAPAAQPGTDATKGKGRRRG